MTPIDISGFHLIKPEDNGEAWGLTVFAKFKNELKACTAWELV
jgi:hypothetical protein